ncbi:hypothetical protein NDU88_007594 [Pleurodeles waltl]|uniref:Uncharacterized protein n=1 Tax=Pleurodeles waltl TaxID=8319 RepID=A0AAV7PU22_PLEWA|nr:hypothetical protein NDU88_007594 [Pleurodeles waltl]
MPRLVWGPGGDRDVDPARSRADQRSWLPLPASMYGGTPPQWAVTEKCCGGAPVGAAPRGGACYRRPT